MHATKLHKIFLKSNCTNNVKENIFYKEKYDRIKHFFLCVVLSNGVEVHKMFVFPFQKGQNKTLFL